MPRTARRRDPWREPDARSPWSRHSRVDQTLALAGDVVDVLRYLRARHLTAPEAAPQLTDELRLMVPALHVALREHAAARVAWQLPADLDAAVLDERAAPTLGAETETFQRREQVDTEAVVGGEHVDVLRARPQLGGVDVLLGPAEGAHLDRPVPEVVRHVRAAHDDGDATVVDEAVIVEAERLCDVRRAEVLLEGEGLLHDGVRVQAGVLAEGHGDGAELLLGGAVEQLVALEEEGVQRALRGHPPRGVVEVGG